MKLLTDTWHQISTLAAAQLRFALINLALMVAIGFCLMAAAVFELQALYGLLLPIYGPAAASALLGALMLIVALALALYMSVRSNKSVPAVPLAAPAPIAAMATAETQPDLAASAAFLAGFLLARRLF